MNEKRRSALYPIIGLVIFIVLIGWWKGSSTSHEPDRPATVSTDSAMTVPDSVLTTLQAQARPVVALYTTYPSKTQSKQNLLDQLGTLITTQALEGVKQDWIGETPTTVTVESKSEQVQFVKTPVEATATKIVLRAEAERNLTYTDSPADTTYPLILVTFEKEPGSKAWSITHLREEGASVGRGVG